MKTRKPVVFALLGIAAALQLTAASFIVPGDAEMVARSRAIVVGTIEGFYPEQSDSGINTIYEVRIERALKGPMRPDDLIRVASYGGVIGDRALVVPGSAHFEA